MRYHKTHLSRRLILELVADQEKEEQLVSKFREAGMPADYVNKLFRMLQDIEVNRDLNSAFRKSSEANNNCRSGATHSLVEQLKLISFRCVKHKDLECGRMVARPRQDTSNASTRT